MTSGLSWPHKLIDQGLQSTLQSGEDGPLPPFSSFQVARVRLPYFASHFDELGNDAEGAHLRRIAAINAGEHRLGDVVEDFAPVMVEDELGDGDVPL